MAAVLQRGEGLSSITGFRVFRLIRMTRIVKAIRLMRIVRFVSALRTLVSSIVHTLKALFWALVLLGFIVYVFAVLFAQAAPPLKSIIYAESFLSRVSRFMTMLKTLWPDSRTP